MSYEELIQLVNYPDRTPFGVLPISSKGRTGLPASSSELAVTNETLELLK